MISSLFLTALTWAPIQETESPLHQPATMLEERTVRFIGVGDLTGANELAWMRATLARPDVDPAMRTAVEERYLDLVEREQERTAAEDLARTIRAFAQMGFGSMRVAVAGRGELVVSGTKAEHAYVDALLAGMREFDGLLDVEFALFQVPRGTTKDVWTGGDAIALSRSRADALVEQLERSGASEPHLRPRAVVDARGTCALSTNLVEWPYVADYERKVLPHLETELIDPVVDVLQTGTKIDLRTVPLRDGRMDVSFSYVHTSAALPFPEETRTLGEPGREVTVQIPAVRTARAQARFELKGNSAIALRSDDPDGEDVEWIVVVRWERVPRADDPRGR